MNANNPMELFHEGFRMTVGATAAVFEALQDPYKREELAREWAEKGAETEREARNFVDTVFSSTSSSSPSGGPTTVPIDADPMPTTHPAAESRVESELQDLTEQISALRQELERLREEENRV